MFDCAAKASGRRLGPDHFRAHGSCTARPLRLQDVSEVPPAANQPPAPSSTAGVLAAAAAPVAGSLELQPAAASEPLAASATDASSAPIGDQPAEGAVPPPDDATTVQPMQQPAQHAAADQAAEPAAADAEAAGLDLLGDFGDGLLPGGSTAAIPQLAVTGSTCHAAVAADFGDLFGDLILSSAQAPTAAAQQAGSSSDAGDVQAMAALNAGAVEFPPAQEEPAQYAAASKRTGAPSGHLEAGGDQSEAELSCDLSDVTTRAEVESACPAAVVQVQLERSITAADLPGSSVPAAADANEQAAGGEPVLDSEGLSDVSTETDADSDIAAADEGQSWQRSLLPPLQEQHQQQPVAAILAQPSTGSAAWASQSIDVGHAGEQQHAELPSTEQAAKPSEVPVNGESPTPAPQQLQQQKQPLGELLLEAAERLEARLAAGGTASRGVAGGSSNGMGEEEASYREDLLLASIISQARPPACSPSLPVCLLWLSNKHTSPTFSCFEDTWSC